MLNRSKIVLTLALALGTASVAMAAPRHSVHRRPVVVVRQVPPAAYQTFDYSGFVPQPGQGQRSDFNPLLEPGFIAPQGGR